MAFESDLIERFVNFRIRSSDNDRRYLATYAPLLDFFRRRIAINDVDSTDAKLAVVLVYTWMSPARLDSSCWDHFALAVDAWSAALAEGLNEVRLSVIQTFVGGSLIATSKFLHFCAPETYAIWDRRVAWAGYRFQYPYQYNQPGRYLTYLQDLRSLNLPDEVADRVRATLGIVTDLRAKEFALFQLGIAEQTE